MAHNSAVNLDISNLSVGFSIAGGTTKRKLTTNGAGDTTLTSQQTIVLTLPNRATDTIVGYGDYSAKGVILVGTGSGTFAALTVGTDAFVLTADSAQTSGVKWAVAPGSQGGTASWVDVTGTTQTMVSTTGYYANNASAVAFTLPATAAKFDVMRITGVQGAWSIAQGSGQSIAFGNTSTAVGVGGSLASTDAGDCVELQCLVANTTWRVLSAVGNLNVV